ncbi:MAG: LysR family transcriptional regulator [Caulobacteraceae bacterium]
MHHTSFRYFYEAARLGSMRAAGEKMGVAVSSISRQIAQLESELGLLLLERGRRNVKLTEAGELALSYYRKSLADREVFDSKVRDLRGLRAGRGGPGHRRRVRHRRLLGDADGFIAKHAGVRVMSTIAISPEVIRRWWTTRCTAGWCSRRRPTRASGSRPRLPQPIMLIARPDHPIAGHNSVTLSDISRHRLCLIAGGLPDPPGPGHGPSGPRASGWSRRCPPTPCSS